MEKSEIVKKIGNLVFYGNLDEETESVLLSAIELIKEQNAKIEELETYNKTLLDANTALSNEFLVCKQNAYREFGEKLAEKRWDAETRIGYVQVVDMNDIEETYKELCGDIAKGLIIANCRADSNVESEAGKWILEKDPNGEPYCFHCSKCDKDFSNIGVKVASKFCPNCGSKMDNEHII